MATWRAIPGWEGLYEASDAGEVRSLPRYRCKGRVLRNGTTGKGYLTVVLSGDSRRHAYTLHRVVAETFLGPKPDGLQTCHIDGDKTNNAVENLKYATQSENEYDKVRHGTHYLANRTHCPQGHEYAPDNTRLHDGNRRSCKACHREQQQIRRAAARQAPALTERKAA